jgi:hypothetical protein
MDNFQFKPSVKAIAIAGPNRIAINGVAQGWEVVPVNAGSGNKEMKKINAPAMPRRGRFSGNDETNFFIFEAP